MRILALIVCLMYMPSAYAKTQNVPDLVFGGEVKPPEGYPGFCLENPGDCPKILIKEPRIIKLTPDVFRKLGVVNDFWNRRIRYTSDEDHWGVFEKWSYAPDGKGDCEDYALEKQRMLLIAGMPREALLLTRVHVVGMPENIFHLVLAVMTDRGPLVLENGNPIRFLRDIGNYSLVSQQSRYNTAVWVAISRPPLQITVTAQKQ